MALADYYLCDVCERKAVYDSDWYDRVDKVEAKKERFDPTFLFGDMRIICAECARAGFRVVVVGSDSTVEDETMSGKTYGRWIAED